MAPVRLVYYTFDTKSLISLENDLHTTDIKSCVLLLLLSKLESSKSQTYRSPYKPITYVDLSTQFGNKFSSVNADFDHEKFNKLIDDGEVDGEVDVKVEIFKSVIGYMNGNNIKNMYYFDDDSKVVDKTKIVSRFFPAMVTWCKNTTSVDNGFEYSGKYIELIVFDYQIYLDLNPDVVLCYVKNKSDCCVRFEPEELCNIELRF